MVRAHRHSTNRRRRNSNHPSHLRAKPISAPQKGRAVNRKFFMKLLLLLLAHLAVFSAAAATPATEIRYTGRLNESGAPANGVYDLRFELFDAASTGNKVGSTNLREDITVANGLFSVTLNFGEPAIFNAPLWVEIGV